MLPVLHEAIAAEKRYRWTWRHAPGQARIGSTMISQLHEGKRLDAAVNERFPPQDILVRALYFGKCPAGGKCLMFAELDTDIDALG
jgi:hypothetical protein